MLALTIGHFAGSDFSSTDFVVTASLVLRAYEITELTGTKSVITHIPGVDKNDIIQSMGKSSRIFSIKGLLISESRDTDRTNLRNYCGEIITLSSDSIPETEVLIMEAKMSEIIGRPLEYHVELKLIEV